MTLDSASLLRVPSPAAFLPSSPVTLRTGALVRGEEAAFREFHAEYAGRLLRYALTVAHGDAALAEEAVQMAWGRIAAKVRVFAEEEAFWAWLACVVRSCVIDCARRHTRHASLLDRLRQEGEEIAAPSPEEAEQPFAAALPIALAALEMEDRELLAAKYEEGVSTMELAVRAGCTPKAMESRLARLRHQVRELVIQRLRHET